MKILYAIQATGNGHISRAMELLPYLQQYGQIDLFLSGANNSLPLEAPVKYRSKGCSLFYNHAGSLNYLKIIKNFSPARIWKEVRELPVENYDLILNDFESITSLACAYKKIPSVQFGHQASFASPLVPLPAQKDRMGEWILKNYSKSQKNIGLHFQPYDSFILPPVIKNDIVQAIPSKQNHVTVYLPAYSDYKLLPYLKKIRHIRFEVFSKEVKQTITDKNISFLPVSRAAFNKSLINCQGIITSAGFETPAEALYLKKKLMVIPIKGQYEQLCNAAALEQMGVISLKEINEDFTLEFCRWMNHTISTPPTEYHHTTGDIVHTAMQMAIEEPIYCPTAYSEFIFN
jgi:uncharacterized protein (TIGR00661 family)